MGKSVKGLSVLMAVCTGMALLAGCSGSGNSGSGGTVSASQPAGSAASAGASAAAAGDDHSPLTLSLYSDRAWYSDWTGPGAKRITQKTGVSFNVKKPVQDDGDGKDIALMIASNSLPDVMVVDAGNKMLQQLIDGNYLYSMDDLIDKYAPDLRNILNDQYGPELLTNFKEKDGKTYKLISGYQTQKYLDEAQKMPGSRRYGCRSSSSAKIITTRSAGRIRPRRRNSWRRWSRWRRTIPTKSLTWATKASIRAI